MMIFKVINTKPNKNFCRHQCQQQNLFQIVLASLLIIFSSSIFVSALADDEDQVLNQTELDFKDSQAKPQETQEPNVLKKPVLVGEYNTDGKARGVTVVGRYAYIADYEKGLKIINIVNPTNPVLAGSLDTDGLAVGVTVVDDYAYVADNDKGLKIINISTPANPSLVGGLSTHAATGVMVIGDYAYIADYSYGLKIINISTPANPSLVGSLATDGNAMEVIVTRDDAYVVDNDKGLKIINIVNPTNPVLVGSLDTDGGANGVAVVGGYAYVADGHRGLKIINITTPSEPDLVGDLDFEYAIGVTILGDYAYVANGGGLKIINVATPAVPVLLGGLDTDGSAYVVVVEGNYAYVADWDKGLKIIRVKDHAPVVSDLYKSVTTDTTITFTVKDFTDKYSDLDEDPLTKIQITSLPANGTLTLSETPVTVNQEIATADLNNLTFEPESKWHGNSSFGWKGFDGFEYSVDGANVNMLIDTPPIVSDISKSGPRNKPLTFSEADFTNKFTDADGDSLTKTKIMNLPKNGVLKLLDKAVSVNQEIVLEDLNYLDFNPETNWHGEDSFGWKGNDGFEYSTTGADINMFIDVPPVVSDLYKSALTDSTVTFNAKDFSDKFSDVEGNELTEIKITSLPINGRLKLAGAAVTADQEIDVKYLDDLTFESTSSWTGKTSFNWKGRHGEYAYSTDPADVNILVVAPIYPAMAGVLDTGSKTNGVAVLGEHSYVTDRYKGLKVVDISSKSQPVVVGGLYTKGEAYGVSVLGDYAYVAAFDGGLNIIDISKAKKPLLIGRIETQGYAYAVTVVDNYAYVAVKKSGAGTINGLEIINITNPSHPFSVGSLETDGDASGISVSGKYLYLADGDKGLKIIDIVNRAAPTLIGCIKTNGSVSDVLVSENYAYVADYDRGLKVIDISTPESPTLVSSLATDGKAIGIKIAVNCAYIADDIRGLKVIDITMPQAPIDIGDQSIKGEASGVTAVGNYAYLADGTGGLKVVRLKSGTPQIGNVYKSGTENESVGFSEEDYSEVFQDSNGERLKKVKVVTLPNDGDLKLAGAEVQGGQEIDAGNLNTLTFNPVSDWYGEAIFSWKGCDRFVYSKELADVRITLVKQKGHSTKESSGLDEEEKQHFCDEYWWSCYVVPPLVAAGCAVTTATVAGVIYLHKKGMWCFRHRGYAGIN